MVDRAAIIIFVQGELPLLNANTLIGTNQVIALEEKLINLITRKLQALEARQTLATKQAPAAPAAAPSHCGKRGATTTNGAKPFLHDLFVGPTVLASTLHGLWRPS